MKLRALRGATDAGVSCTPDNRPLIVNSSLDNSLVKNSAQQVWKVVFAVTGALALVWLTGTATFLFNVKDTRFVAHAGGFGVEHNCLTAYAVAVHLAVEGGDNIYDPSYYRNTTIPTPIHESVRGIFTVDGFHYPPPFLILPYSLLKVFGDFFKSAWRGNYDASRFQRRERRRIEQANKTA